MHLPRRLWTAALALLLVAGTAGPALADSWHASEPRRDVRWYSFDPDPAPCGTWTRHIAKRDKAADITRVAVRYAASDVHVVVHLRDLAESGRQSTEITLKTDEGWYSVEVNRLKAGGPTHAFLSELRLPTEADDECGSYSTGSASTSCAGFDADMEIGLDRIVADIPRDCVSSPRWVRAGARTDKGRSGHFDFWQPAGVRYVKFVGALGPRVRRD